MAHLFIGLIIVLYYHFDDDDDDNSDKRYDQSNYYEISFMTIQSYDHSTYDHSDLV